MRPRPGTVGAVLALLVVVGCSGETGEASPSTSRTPSETSTASPSASPEEQVPDPPPNADKRTDRAAIDFAVYFVDVLNYTARSGDTDELRRISTNRCQSCKNIIEVTESAYSNDGYIRGDGWSVNSYSAFAPGPDQKRIVSLLVDTSAQTYRPSANEPEKTIKKGRGRLNVHVKPRNRSWVVTRMDRAE